MTKLKSGEDEMILYATQVYDPKTGVRFMLGAKTKGDLDKQFQNVVKKKIDKALVSKIKIKEII